MQELPFEHAETEQRLRANRLARACLLATFIFAVGAPQMSLAAPQAEQVRAERPGDVQADRQQSGPSLSKFEARRIHRRCRDQVADSSASKELRHCFELHIAARRLWGECKREPKIGILRGREKEDAIRRCVLEKRGSGKRGQP